MWEGNSDGPEKLLIILIKYSTLLLDDYRVHGMSADFVVVQEREGRWESTRPASMLLVEWFAVREYWDSTTGEFLHVLHAYMYITSMCSPVSHVVSLFVKTLFLCWWWVYEFLSSPPCLHLIFDRLSAGLLRQATYSTTRLGVYQSLFDYFSGWVLRVIFMRNKGVCESQALALALALVTVMKFNIYFVCVTQVVTRTSVMHVDNVC